MVHIVGEFSDRSIPAQAHQENPPEEIPMNFYIRTGDKLPGRTTLLPADTQAPNTAGTPRTGSHTRMLYTASPPFQSLRFRLELKKAYRTPPPDFHRRGRKGLLPKKADHSVVWPFLLPLFYDPLLSSLFLWLFSPSHPSPAIRPHTTSCTLAHIYTSRLFRF